jgi:hypothetical protein
LTVEYHRHDSIRRLVVTIDGRVTVRDVREMLDYQANSGAWGYAVVYDERAAHVDLSAGDMRGLAAHAMALTQRKGKRGPVAIVANENVDYGLNRMASAYADAAGYEIGVFRTMGEALDWIGDTAAPPT